MIRIMNTGDIHLGRKFSNYSDELSKKLENARYETLKNIVVEANNKKCNIFVITGDLFDKITMTDLEVLKTIDILREFSGNVLLVLPGNHDHSRIDPWKVFKENITDGILFLEEQKKYSLKRFGLDVDIYAAPCDSKHSANNNLSWMKEISERNDKNIAIGIAHGAIEGISPDMTDSYFKMTKNELRDLNMDLWLIGHTHMPIPKIQANTISNNKIFNAGTPEPDGFNCNHKGFAWYIEIENKEKIKAELIKTGKYYFEEINAEIVDEKDFEDLLKAIKNNNPENKLIRLNLRGRIEDDLYNQKNEYYNKIYQIVTYARVIDDDLNLKITEEKIKEEFPEGSYPYLFLNELIGEDKTLEIAYELIREVKE